MSIATKYARPLALTFATLSVLGAGLTLAAATGCSGENAASNGGGSGSSPAVMISLLVPSPDASNFYVGVYRITGEGAELALSTSGFLCSIGRVR